MLDEYQARIWTVFIKVFLADQYEQHATRQAKIVADKLSDMTMATKNLANRMTIYMSRKNDKKYSVVIHACKLCSIIPKLQIFLSAI